MPRTSEQRGVIAGILPAVALTIVVIAMAVTGVVLPAMPVRFEERVAIWAASSAIAGIPLLYCVIRLANHRFFSPQDIAGAGFGDGTPKAKMLQAMLQNTLEQTILAALGYAAWCFLAPASWGVAPAIACIMLLVGRIAFFAGYERGAAARSVGFALTFYPSLAMIAVIAPFAMNAIASPWFAR